MSQISHLVSDYEHATVAIAFQQIGDFEQANKYWARAVTASPDDYYSVMNLRGYARSLFSQAKFEPGRSRFQERISLLPFTSDPDKWSIAETYQSWASIEAEELIHKAEEIYNQIQNRRLRNEGLSNLDEVRKSIFPDTETENGGEDAL